MTMMPMKFLPSTGSGSRDIIILIWSIRGKRGRGGSSVDDMVISVSKSTLMLSIKV